MLDSIFTSVELRGLETFIWKVKQGKLRIGLAHEQTQVLNTPCPLLRRGAADPQATPLPPAPHLLTAVWLAAGWLAGWPQLQSGPMAGWVTGI